MSYRNTASYGKRQEYIVIAELLRRGFDVYMTLVDDQGIDCVLRIGPTRYLDIQIKARSTNAKYKSLFAGLDFEPRENLFFIFYTEFNDTHWVMPSADVVKHCHQNKTGKNAGKRQLNLPKSDSGVVAERFANYSGPDGFGLLK